MRNFLAISQILRTRSCFNQEIQTLRLWHDYCSLGCKDQGRFEMSLTLRQSLIALCALGASPALIGCDEECVETDAGGVCVDYYGDAYYYDSLVSGVTYENLNGEGEVVRSAITGEGDDPGRFRFDEGQSVRFSLGDTVLGETPTLSSDDDRVTPFDLVGIEEEAVGGCEVDEGLPADTEPFHQVVHHAVFLQTFDTDGDPTEGIEISADVAALFDGETLEFDQLWTDFQQDLQLVLDKARSAGALPNEREIREREEALRALYRGIGLCE
jgi:hypothetical protein